MKSNPEVVKMLNVALSMELGSTLQYLHHHWTGEGFESESILPVFSKFSIDEMKHAEKVAERINFLGGNPTISPTGVRVRKDRDLRKMVEDDLAGEYEAIEYYRKIIKLCNGVGDTTTRLMMEEILSTAEEHTDKWETLLEKGSNIKR